MSKTHKAKSTKPSVHGPLGRKILNAIKGHTASKIVKLSDAREARELSAELQKTVATREQLAEHDPIHATYAAAQNQLSVLTEMLLELPPTRKLAERLAEADETYMPGGPPMSPLTNSYFFSWASFDCSTGGAKPETMTTVAIDVSQFSGADPELIGLYETLQNSRMGIYQHEGFDGPHVILRELITDEVFTAHSTTGYQGNTGELWYVRLLPPPIEHPALDYHVCFTTPYLLLGHSKSEWVDCLYRLINKLNIDDTAAAYHHLLKYGPQANYWNEYVFLAYSNFREDVIFLSGLPDRPETLPHSDLA